MKRPDFFIVGAPKCGTTALDNYLGQHPDIFMAPKEMHFFASQFESRTRVSDIRSYLRYFEASTSERIAGESSVLYLCAEQAPVKIRNFNDLAKIIIMLRNPLDMIYSLYSQTCYSGYEDQPTFEDALNVEPDRTQGRLIPKHANGVHRLLYRRVATFTPQVQRYLNVFGRENTHIIVFDDLASRTSEVYAEVLDFLGVDRNFIPGFEVVNPNRVAHSRTLLRLTIHPPRPVRLLAKSVVPRAWRRGAQRVALRLNTRYVERPPMKPETRALLCREFMPDVERLSDLLGRDLTHWCRT